MSWMAFGATTELIHSAIASYIASRVTVGARPRMGQKNTARACMHSGMNNAHVPFLGAMFILLCMQGDDWVDRDSGARRSIDREREREGRHTH
jgi:hypothetical protein